jgi:hypothetical protein
MTFSRSTREMCEEALRAVAYDADLAGPKTNGFSLACDDATMGEITGRWPDFGRFVVRCDCGQCLPQMRVPSCDAEAVLRSLARAAMN